MIDGGNINTFCGQFRRISDKEVEYLNTHLLPYFSKQ